MGCIRSLVTVRVPPVWKVNGTRRPRVHVHLLYSFPKTLIQPFPYIPPPFSLRCCPPRRTHLTAPYPKNPPPDSLKQPATQPDCCEQPASRIALTDASSRQNLASDRFGMAQRGPAQASVFYRPGKQSLKKDNVGVDESGYSVLHNVAYIPATRLNIILTRFSTRQNHRQGPRRRAERVTTRLQPPLSVVHRIWVCPIVLR